MIYYRHSMNSFSEPDLPARETPAPSCAPARFQPKFSNGEDEAYDYAMKHGQVVRRLMAQGMPWGQAFDQASKEVPMPVWSPDK
jgi:hypothetical protein